MNRDDTDDTICPCANGLPLSIDLGDDVIDIKGIFGIQLNDILAIDCPERIGCQKPNPEAIAEREPQIA